MAEADRTIWRRGFPSGLVGAFILIALVEVSLFSRIADLSSAESFSWRLAAKAASELAPACDVLGLGDSLMIHGFQPDMVESRAGGRIMNLAAAAAQAPTTYFLLRRAIESGARPGWVVVDFAPYLLHKAARFNRNQWASLPAWRDVTELLFQVGQPAFALDIALKRALPSYQTRSQLRWLTVGRLRGEPYQAGVENQAVARQWLVHRGALVQPAIPGFQGQLSQAERDLILNTDFRVDHVNRHFLDRFLALTARHQIQVVWVLTPFAPNLLQEWYQTGSATKERQLIQDLLKRHSHLTVLDARHSGYGNELFRDSVHLALPGALALSRDLGNYLSRKSQNPASRWSQLPPYRAASEWPSIEDFEESRRLVLSTSHPLR